MSFDAPQGQPDVNQGSTASTAPTSDVNQTTAAPSPAASPDVNKPADTSSAEGVKTEAPKTLSEMIKSGLAKITGKEPATATPADTAKKPETEVNQDKKADGQPEDEVSEEEKKAPTEIQNHPAFKQVVNERTQARRKLNAALKEVEVYKTDATRYQSLQTYLTQNEVPQEDAATAIKFAAMWRNDPEKLLVELDRMRHEIGTKLGKVLPKDLQDEVDQGLITEERASELAREKGRVAIQTEQIQRSQERSQAQQQTEEFNFRVKLTENWAGQLSKTDPDLQRKFPMITERLNFLLRTEGDPKDAQAAWDRLNRAYTDVNARLKSFVPPKPATNPIPPSGGVIRQPAEAPKTLEDAFATGFQRLRAQA